MRLDNVNSTNDEAKFKISGDLVPMKSLCCAGTNNPYYVILRARD